MKIPDERLLAEFEELIRTAPSYQELTKTDNHSWLGRAAAAIEAWDYTRSAVVMIQTGQFNVHSRQISEAGYGAILTVLHQGMHTVRMKTVGPLSVALGAGTRFDYFDLLRKIIEMAREDILFVDPYLNPEFVSRYLGNVAAGTEVRLLTHSSPEAKLVPAARLFAAQSNLSLQVRFAKRDMHDRFVFIDKSTCYQSGASFKDGGIKPTVLTQITDAFESMYQTYQRLWDEAVSTNQE